MALTRKFLAALGIESDKVDEIINAHSETISALKEARDNAEAKAQENATAAEKLATMEKELETTRKKLEAAELYEEKYNKLNTEYTSYKSGVEAEKVKASKLELYKNLLREANIGEKYIDKITRLADIDNMEIDKDGKLKDSDKLTESVKQDWAEFISVEGTKGADTKKPPKGNDDEKPDVSYAQERAAQYYANRYGVIKEEK